MEIGSLHLDESGWVCDKEMSSEAGDVDLVFVFGETDALADPRSYHELKERYPNAHIVGTSTAGNIQHGRLNESAIVATAVSFEKSHVEVGSISGVKDEELVETTRQLVEGLPQEGLRSVFILADGLYYNGSHIAKGANLTKNKVPVSGGLGGDGFRFERVLVMADDVAKDSTLVAIGLYGEDLRIDIGSKAGWTEFGADRIITRSEGNIVYTIDDRPAITLYEAYLGEYIKELPGSALNFPLSVRDHMDKNEVIRVMMGVNEDGSITYAGDVPEGSLVRLMKTNVNHLIDGADILAQNLASSVEKDTLVLAVSCSGRRSVLKQLVDEELITMQEQFGSDAEITGFYSYGELAPFRDDILTCKLHNQTMTVTTISEV